MDAQFSSWGGKKNSVRLIFEKKPEVAAVFLPEIQVSPERFLGACTLRFTGRRQAAGSLNVSLCSSTLA